MSYSPMNNLIKPIISLSSDRPVLHILYEDNHTLFDKTIEHCDNVCLIPYNSGINFLSYDAYFSNNPMNCINNIVDIKRQHIPTIVYYQDSAPANIKKEDKFLIQDKLSTAINISRNNNITNQWHITNKTITLEYGVPTVRSNSPRNKSIVLLNLHKNKTVQLIYQSIKQHWPDALMLDNISDMSITDIQSLLQEYQLCIELHDAYNIGVALASGCRVITHRSTEFDEYVYLSRFHNVNDLIPHLKQELDTYHSYNPSTSIETIQRNYDFDSFKNNLYSILIDSIRKPLYI